MYVSAVYVAILTAAPLVHAVSQPSLVALQTGYPTFEQLDRNRDGFVAGVEAAALPGLAAILQRADLNRYARLDKVEYARALAILDGHR
jgi:hypothetical protein